MEQRIADWKLNFEEIWKKLDEQDERIEKLIHENQQLRERVDRLEIASKMLQI